MATGNVVDSTFPAAIISLAVGCEAINLSSSATSAYVRADRGFPHPRHHWHGITQ